MGALASVNIFIKHPTHVRGKKTHVYACTCQKVTYARTRQKDRCLRPYEAKRQMSTPVRVKKTDVYKLRPFCRHLSFYHLAGGFFFSICDKKTDVYKKINSRLPNLRSPDSIHDLKCGSRADKIDATLH